MSGERTEAATPRKREEARQKGQVARSREVSSVAVLFAGLFVLSRTGGDLLHRLRVAAEQAFLQAGSRDATPDSVLALAMSTLWTSWAALIPLMAAVTLVGIAVNMAQVGPLLSLRTIEPDFSRVNLLKGLKGFISARSLAMLVNASFKVTVTGFVAYQVIKERFWDLVRLQTATAEGAVVQVGGMIFELAIKCGLALLVMAAADLVYQRRSYEGGLKMSKSEIKDEARQTEGDPHLKGKLRQMAKQFAAQRMMHRVPDADVVVTNPVHLAVALEYKHALMAAPVVVAKGQLLVAEQIKRIAREHGVPVLENPPLARSIYRSVDVGMAIPPDLYQAVAEVLAFVYRLQRRSAAF